jgi:DNA-binding CsgD family transcriptional regulator
MAEIAEGEGTLLFADTTSDVQWTCSPAIRQAVERWANDGWAAHNSRGQRLVPIREPRFLTDLDVFTRDELERDPYYTEFLRPNGLGWCVGTSIHSPSGDTLVFSVEKAHHKGPVDRGTAALLDGLRPHLARSALLSARIGLERARATVETLQTLGFPAVVLSRKGQVITMNTRFAACAPAIAVGARDEIRFSNLALHGMFDEALTAVQSGSQAQAGRSFPIPAAAGQAAMIAHLLPLRGNALDIFSGAIALMFVTPLVRQNAPQPALLEALFDLTPAEARIASSLVEGRSVAEIAKAQGIMQNSVRGQLKSIFAKTGVHRQAELVSLLALQTYGENDRS